MGAGTDDARSTTGQQNGLTLLAGMCSIYQRLDEVDRMLVTMKILQKISTENDAEYVRDPGV